MSIYYIYLILNFSIDNKYNYKFYILIKYIILILNKI